MVKTKRVIIILLMFLVFVFALESCGSIYESNVNNNSLLLYSDLTQSEINVLKELSYKWGEENNIKVKVSNNEDDYNTSDVVYGVRHDKLQKSVKEQCVDEVPEEIIRNSEYCDEKIVQAITIDNKTYGVAIGQETCALFYNMDYINKVPESMEDLEKIASKYKVGFQFDINDLYNVYGFIENENSSGYEFLKKVICEDKLINKETTKDVAENNFENGKIGFFISQPYEISKLKKDKKINLGIAAIPSLGGKPVKSLLSVETAFVKNNSKNKDKSWELVKYLNENNKEIIEKGNRIPVIKEEFENEEFKNREFTNGFLDQIKNSILLPDDEIENSYKDKIKEIMNSKIN